MTDTFLVLAQVLPAVNTLTTLYTVPAGSAVISTLKVCNQASYDTTFRISIAVAGAADATKQYIYYDVPIAANDTFSATEGYSLATTDVIRCRSGNGQVSFTVFGVRVT